VPGLAGRAVYLAYRAGADVARALPPALGVPAARTVSRGMTLLWRTRRRQVERNLERVTAGPPGTGLRGAELRSATAGVFANYSRYWYEMFRLRGDTTHALEDAFESDGYDNLEVAVAEGRGTILALPHLGNWDLAGAWLAQRGNPLTVVTEPAEPAELHDWFVRQREDLGMEVVPLGPHTVARVLRALGTGRVVCLVCDRDISGVGVEVQLFGATTTMPGGPALLALRTGAPLLPAAAYFRPGGRHRARILPPVPAERRGALRDDVVRVTQDLAHRFEELIRAAPEQWLVMQPVWPDDTERGGNGAG
jgi:phosphatidylinositol dimannoside acyltransferase